MTLIATPEAPTANSYCTVADASLVLNDRLDTLAWQEAPLLQREQALIWATRLLDEQAAWQTTPTTVTQALWWPCVDALDRAGNDLDEHTIPVFLVQATAEYALALLVWQQTMPPKVPQIPTRMKFGSHEFEFDGAPLQAPMERLPVAIRRLIAPYARPIGGGMSRILRV